MKNNKSIKYLLGGFFCLFFLFSCQDTDELSKEINLLKDRAVALETATKSLNTSLESLQALLKADIIVGVTYVGDKYRIELNDGSTIEVVQASKVNLSIPLLSISKEGFWVFSTDNGVTFNSLTDEKGNKIPATAESADKTAVTPLLRVNLDGFWEISTNGGATYSLLGGKECTAIGKNGVSEDGVFKEVVYDSEKKILTVTLTDGQVYKIPCTESFYLRIPGTSKQQVFPLGEKRVYEVEQNEVSAVTILAPDDWQADLEEQQLTIIAPSNTSVEKEENIKIIYTSIQGYLRMTTISVKLLTTGFDANATLAWNRFATNSPENILLDFSYAGYKHGTEAPPAVHLKSNDYTVYNVKDYGAKGDGKTSDREALLSITQLFKYQANAKAIIYFPEGDYVLHTAADDENGVSKPIEINFGGFVLKGAGRDKTIIRMADRNVNVANSTPPAMINIKHTVDLQNPVRLTGDVAPKGTFVINVADASSFSAGQWVCLRLIDTSPSLINKELTSITADGNVWNKTANSQWTNLTNSGVQVYDYHQIVNKKGNEITFAEPLMHEVDPQWKWELCKFNYYENIGIEDLTFAGNTQPGFLHHGNNGRDDNDYKPIGMMRLVNSWIRRVDFTNISEALSISSSANISAYDIEINGHRGHSAIRSGGSSRIFIGKVHDHSNGYIAIDENTTGTYLDNAGQFHGCGVSKQSMGTVIWNVTWGEDACFEAHATQPRATLFDCCNGAFIKLHQGGAKSELPNHLDDLTLWNFNATNTNSVSQGSFTWWDGNWTCFLPPTIVGFHGPATSQLTFSDNEVKLNESYNTAVEPYSLYEAQLRKRLGYVPAWINSLK